jgi:hypothetical protein
MSLNRYATKRDLNELDVIKALTDFEVTVWQLSSQGLPDLMCYMDGQLFLVEVKNGRAGRLTPRQQKFFSNYTSAEPGRGVPAYIVTDVDEVPDLIESELARRS